MSRTAAEITTQPACWRRAAAEATGFTGAPRPGERVAVVGCGTSWFMAQAYAALREGGGQGTTDAFAASEFPHARTAGAYDRVVALTRSGTTTEVLELLARVRAAGTTTVALTADPATPVMTTADEVAVLDWADEESVVQTRFATSALAFLRATLGDLPGLGSVARAADEAEHAVTEPLSRSLLTAEQWTFLGRGWAYGLAQEAALKMREAAGAWTEAYPAMEYRHGPVAIAAPGRVTWLFGEAPDGLAEEVRAVGGHFEHHPSADPLADLVRAQRLAVALAESRGQDPDRPRNLTRSVVLGAGTPGV
ncbi:fructoselysine-6-P-deglycase FrlB-like protein [Streptomyces sp. DSM 41037]|uniref:SIS domain-containing protein n=1 Tax=Streptomyces sp. DSM 41037 TaxID=2817710 RepID=UPI002782F8AB|nr:SIS domain-containing protein [Streptomyces sp. DSM 41037]MDQ0294070.1 fructoselysine-6-P-deglycase FrlB-like protein [Streptomyces sp. DSM 41037]